MLMHSVPISENAALTNCYCHHIFNDCSDISGVGKLAWPFVKIQLPIPVLFRFSDLKLHFGLRRRSLFTTTTTLPPLRNGELQNGTTELDRLDRLEESVANVLMQ